MQVLSKGAFAIHIGVSAARISQYLDSGLIGSECLVGEGRFAKINVALAIEQIRARRDIGQALGNGLGTRLEVEAPSAAPVAVQRPPTVDDELKAERLEAERRKNRVAAQEEATRLGQLVPAAELRRQLTRLASSLDEEAGGMLSDFATAVAAEFHLPHRDVLHLLRRVRSEKKAAVANRARQRADAEAETVSAVIEDVAA